MQEHVAAVDQGSFAEIDEADGAVEGGGQGAQGELVTGRIDPGRAWATVASCPSSSEVVTAPRATSLRMSRSLRASSRTLALCSASSACCLPASRAIRVCPCVTCWPELTAMVAMRPVTSGLMATERLAASLLTSLMEGSARLCLTVSVVQACWQVQPAADARRPPPAIEEEGKATATRAFSSQDPCSQRERKKR